VAGMFNLFGAFHFHERTPLFRGGSAEEISLPFAAAFFVFTQSIGNQSVWQSIALSVRFFSLYVFGN
jgi:hypothetical protein